ncbi:hypothetical protein D3C71_1814980 [compost metagenome]
MRIGGLPQALVRELRLLCQRGHCVLYHGTNRLARLACAGSQALLQRGPNGAGQLRVGGRSLAMKSLLLGQQLRVELVIAALQAFHQPLQAFGNQRHGMGLRLKSDDHFVPSVRR